MFPISVRVVLSDFQGHQRHDRRFLRDTNLPRTGRSTVALPTALKSGRGGAKEMSHRLPRQEMMHRREVNVLPR